MLQKESDEYEFDFENIDDFLAPIFTTLKLVSNELDEKTALIGFAGPRVIEQTVREKLPDGLQRSEFLLEHGDIDMIIDRRELRAKISEIISILTHQEFLA